MSKGFIQKAQVNFMSISIKIIYKTKNPMRSMNKPENACRNPWLHHYLNKYEDNKLTKDEL
jgi:hypothetical protein